VLAYHGNIKTSSYYHSGNKKYGSRQDDENGSTETIKPTNHGVNILCSNKRPLRISGRLFGRVGYLAGTIISSFTV